MATRHSPGLGRVECGRPGTHLSTWCEHPLEPLKQIGRGAEGASVGCPLCSQDTQDSAADLAGRFRIAPDSHDLVTVTCKMRASERSAKTDEHNRRSSHRDSVADRDCVCNR